MSAFAFGAINAQNDNGSSFLTPDEARVYNNKKQPFHHLARIIKENYYDLDVVQQIRVIYLIAALVWLIIVWYCQLYVTDPIVWFFIVVPIGVFAINYANADKHTKDLENEMFSGNFLSMAFLIVAIVLSYSKVGGKAKYFKLLFLALVFIMFSLIDVWLPTDKLILCKHIRSIFQTSAIALLAITFYLFYVDIGSINPKAFAG